MPLASTIAARKAAGLCLGCGALPPKQEHSKCETCLQKQRNYRKHKRTQDFDQGLCTASGCKNPISKGHMICDPCRTYRKNLAMDRGKRNKKAGLCRCGIKPSPGFCLCDNCRAKKVEADLKLKIKVLTHYSNGDVPQCACCEEIILQFLQIDHINGDGAEHRRSIGKGKEAGSSHTYRWLVRNNFPPGFQVLCANCNIGRHINGGVCPHQTNAGKPATFVASLAAR